MNILDIYIYVYICVYIYISLHLSLWWPRHLALLSCSESCQRKQRGHGGHGGHCQSQQCSRQARWGNRQGGSTLLICGITIKYVIMTGNLCTLLVCTLLLLVHCSYAHCNKDNYHINNDIFYHLVIITSLVIMVEPTIMIMITWSGWFQPIPKLCVTFCHHHKWVWKSTNVETTNQ